MKEEDKDEYQNQKINEEKENLNDVTENETTTSIPDDNNTTNMKQFDEDNYAPSIEDSQIKKQRQYQNVLKFEQQYNTGAVTAVNSLQDTEINDIIVCVDNYLSLCLKRINDIDPIFNVSSKCFEQLSVSASSQTSNGEAGGRNANKKSSTLSGLGGVGKRKATGDRKSTAASQSHNEGQPPKTATMSKLPKVGKTSDTPFVDREITASMIKITDDYEDEEDEEEEDEDFLSLKQEALHSDDENEDSYSANQNQNKNRILNIGDCMPIDLLRMGLKGCPLAPKANKENRPSSVAAAAADTITLNSNKNKISAVNTQQERTFSRMSANSTTGSNHHPNDISFRYMLVLELDKTYFETKQLSEPEQLYSIQMKRRPNNWSLNDLAEFTLHRNVPPADKKSNSTFLPKINNIDNKRSQSGCLYAYTNNKKMFSSHSSYKNASSTDDYSSPPLSNQYLNSKAIFDRLHKHFHTTMHDHWLKYENIQLAQLDVAKLSAYARICNAQLLRFLNVSKEGKQCKLRHNRLRCTFKWKSDQQQQKTASIDKNINLTIELVIKFAPDKKLKEQCRVKVGQIVSRFMECGGFCARPMACSLISQPKILNFLIRWLRKHIQLNLLCVYLRPNTVHYWLLSLRQLKLNVLRFLFWLNSFGEETPGIECIEKIMNPNSNTIKLNSKTFNLNSFFITNSNTPSVMQQNKSSIVRRTSNTSTVTGIGSNSKRIGSTAINIGAGGGARASAQAKTFRDLKMVDDQSNLFILFKQLQIFNYLTFGTNEHLASVETQIMLDDLVIENLLLEIETCPIKETKEIKKNNSYGFEDEEEEEEEVYAWSHDLLFDRLWSCLLRVRQSVLNLRLTDSFGLTANVLPIVFFRYFCTLPISQLRLFDNGAYNRSAQYCDSVDSFDSRKRQRMPLHGMPLVVYQEEIQRRKLSDKEEISHNNNNNNNQLDVANRKHLELKQSIETVMRQVFTYCIVLAEDTTTSKILNKYSVEMIEEKNKQHKQQPPMTAVTTTTFTESMKI